MLISGQIALVETGHQPMQQGKSNDMNTGDHGIFAVCSETTDAQGLVQVHEVMMSLDSPKWKIKL